MLTAELLEPIITAVTGNIGVAIAAGIGVYAIKKALGVGLQVLSSFING